MNKLAGFALLLIATVIAMFLPAVAEWPHKPVVSISIPALNIKAGERVVGFSFQVMSGRIAQIPDTPIGWNISVNNDPSWNTRMDASIIMAAAAVDTSFFENFLVVEEGPSLGNPFQIRGEIIVSKDFSNVRRIQVGMKDVSMKER